MGEQDDPFIANEVMEVDGTLSSVGVEVGSNATQAQSEKRVSILCDLLPLGQEFEPTVEAVQMLSPC